MLKDVPGIAHREAGWIEAEVPVTIARVGLDDWSNVRHLHVLSFSRLLEPSLSDGEAALQAFKACVDSPEHAQNLQAANLNAAWVDGYIVGTCGWLTGGGGDSGTAARLTAVYVDPMFTRLGIGRRLVREAEAQAFAAGFRVLTARAPSNSVAFFASIGFGISSNGVHSIEGLNLPVAFMRKTCTAPPSKSH